MHRYTIVVDGKSFTLDVRELAADQFRVTVDGKELDVNLASDEWKTGNPVCPVETQDRSPATNELNAPMPGLIVAIDVKPGARVERGDTLLTLEAMKMRNAIRAPRDAVIGEVLVEEGQTVAFGERLLRFGDAR